MNISAHNSTSNSSSTASLRLFSVNICSLRHKVVTPTSEILRFNPDIVAVLETWLTPLIPDSDLHIPNFTLVRRDRQAQGGGVAIYVKDYSGYSIPDLPLDPSIECLCIDVHLGTKTTRLCNVYRPLNSQADWLDKFNLNLDSICDTKRDIILMGDFNYDYLITNESRDFKNTLSLYNLLQHINEPTRFGNTRASCVDHFITRRSNKSIIHTSIVSPPFDSDHCSIVVQVGRPEKRKSVLKTQWLPSRGGLRRSLACHCL